jgi:hypothetical protein
MSESTPTVRLGGSTYTALALMGIRPVTAGAGAITTAFLLRGGAIIWCGPCRDSLEESPRRLERRDLRTGMIAKPLLEKWI